MNKTSASTRKRSVGWRLARWAKTTAEQFALRSKCREVVLIMKVVVSFRCSKYSIYNALYRKLSFLQG